MSALWKQCQQGSSNEGWAKYIQAAALALGVSTETGFATSLADAPRHDVSRREEFGPGGKKACKEGGIMRPFTPPLGFVEIHARTLE
jgi:hypothetical protein